ncbi:PAP2 superfamily protein [Rubripirellula obstinata]|uniref:PAP2 superfamily protein n=1 Tax=Rubripirellula obstinata TaxID=406547 RepID=A0A5B1CI37_9BACT|nr:phosphatase PAP2 family protein [Rubripirellula obstinata]KAA1259349.1 PAP2 superfamily protein [Rubripirellula obstinata]
MNSRNESGLGLAETTASQELTASGNGFPSTAYNTVSFRLASLLWMAGITLLMVPMATLFDVSIARWIATDPLPDFAVRILNLSVYYAQGIGVFLMLTSVILLMPRRRWCVPRLATLAMGAGAVATLAKMFVLRPRPSTLYLEAAGYDYAWIWAIDWNLSQVATFDAGTRAFPSASLATATALTVGLWAVQPKGRWLFVSLCVGTMLQRTYCGAHFVSDLFGSASVGLGWAYVCYHPSLMGSVFDKMEPGREARVRRRYYKRTESTNQSRKAGLNEATEEIQQSPPNDDRIAA